MAVSLQQHLPDSDLTIFCSQLIKVAQICHMTEEGNVLVITKVTPLLELT